MYLRAHSCDFPFCGGEACTKMRLAFLDGTLPCFFCPTLPHEVFVFVTSCHRNRILERKDAFIGLKKD